MRLRHNDVNFEVTFDDHQNTSKCSQNMFLSNLDDLHMWGYRCTVNLGVFKVVLYNINITAMCSVTKCKQSCLIDN